MKNWKIATFTSGEEIKRDIYFNKKRRKKLKTSFLKAQKAILENTDLSIKPVLREEYNKRHLVTSALAFTVRGLETIKKAEEYDKTLYLTNCKFTLFKKGKSFVFVSKFKKPLLNNKLMISFLYFPQGFPKISKKKTFIYKSGRRVSLRGFKEIDSGTFKQKVLNYKVFNLKYKGQNENYDFRLMVINEDSQSYWTTKL